MTHESTSDVERIARETWLRRAVLAGDESAWRSWYAETFDSLHGFVCARCGARREWVDEVVQETWLLAVRRMADFDPSRASLAQWLRGIAVNQLRALARRSSRTANVEIVWNELPEESPTLPAVDGAEVQLALESLSDRQAAVLRAKYLQEQSVQEIAAAWQETPKSIESLLSRARESFRAVYRRIVSGGSRHE